MPSFVGPIRKTKSREGGNDNIKRVRGIKSVRTRISEKRNNLKHLSKGSWPAMREDKRHRSRPFALLMHEVNLPLICLESVMAESRDPVYLSFPVEAVGPVTAEIGKEAAIKSVCPVRVWYLIRPSRSLQTIPQILHSRG